MSQFQITTLTTSLALETATGASSNQSAPDPSESESVHSTRSIMSAGQEFAVSAAAAGLSHLIHHPLYTLKSQMMFYGPQFRLKEFFRQAITQRTSFLYRGKRSSLYFASLVQYMV